MPCHAEGERYPGPGVCNVLYYSCVYHGPGGNAFFVGQSRFRDSSSSNPGRLIHGNNNTPPQDLLRRGTAPAQPRAESSFSRKGMEACLSRSIGHISQAGQVRVSTSPFKSARVWRSPNATIDQPSTHPRLGYPVINHGLLICSCVPSAPEHLLGVSPAQPRPGSMGRACCCSESRLRGRHTPCQFSSP